MLIITKRLRVSGMAEWVRYGAAVAAGYLLLVPPCAPRGSLAARQFVTTNQARLLSGTSHTEQLCVQQLFAPLLLVLSTALRTMPTAASAVPILSGPPPATHPSGASAALLQSC